MSDEQVSELRYIEELEAEVEKLREISDAVRARNVQNASRARVAEAEVEKLQRSTVHALYQGQKKRAEAAEAKLAEETALRKELAAERLRLNSKLAEVEKYAKHWHEKCGEQFQAIERARELAEGLAGEFKAQSDARSQNAADCFVRVARLLSGRAEE